MRLSDLSPEVVERIKAVRYDRIIEKHEGPWDWEGKFRYGDPEFLMVNQRAILLPIDREHHPNITILRAMMSEDGNTLTLFLKDTTYVSDPQWENFDAGRIAICQKMRGEDFYIATVYHEWFVVDNSLIVEI